MIIPQRENKQLLLKYEVLKARLDIRDFFLKTAVKEVYENIGQVLSLVRVQLAYLNPSNEKPGPNQQSAGELVGQSIRDLKSMCRSFYPDVDITKEDGFVEALISTAKILGLDDDPKIGFKNEKVEINDDLKLIVFKMLQEILISIKDEDAIFKSIIISREASRIQFKISFKGAISINSTARNSVNEEGLSFNERIELIDGKLLERKGKAESTSLLLQVPLI